MDNERLTDDGVAVVDAWKNEGIAPGHHRAMQRLLATEWPALYKAITENLE